MSKNSKGAPIHNAIEIFVVIICYCCFGFFDAIIYVLRFGVRKNRPRFLFENKFVFYQKRLIFKKNSYVSS